MPDKAEPESVVPPSESEQDVTALTRLLEYCRSKGFRIGPEVTIGCISVKVSDLRQSKKEGLVAPREMNILEEHGLTGDDE